MAGVVVALLRADSALARVEDADTRAVVTLLTRLTSLLTPPYDVEAAREAAHAARRAMGLFIAGPATAPARCRDRGKQ